MSDAQQREPAGVFADPGEFTAIPRLLGLALSPDGSRLVVPVQERSPDGRRLSTALWEVDPLGERDARRLTRSAAGEGSPAFLASGEVLFTSKRPDPAAVEPPQEEAAALWALPTGPGDARQVLSWPGGVMAVRAPRAGSGVVLVAEMMAGAPDRATDAERRTSRREAGVTAILHDRSPVRHWDHDLGPSAPHLLALDLPPAGDDTAWPEPRDLTPTPGRALDEADLDVSADGSLVVTTWAVDDAPGYPRSTLVAIDVATGARRVLADEPGASYASPAISPDGALVACIRVADSSFTAGPRHTLVLVERSGATRRELAGDLDLWPQGPTWAPDGTAVYVTADELGHSPVLRIEVGTGATTRLSAAGAHTSVCPSPDGTVVYALRSSYAHPFEVVRYPAAGRDEPGTVLPAPGAVEVPGRVEEVTATAEDGTPLRAWLVLPEGASPAAPSPLVLWVHGGPLASWNAWSWRWCPWLLAARGYAVLLPDPALSTGYGQAMIERGWGQWGGTPYTDLMTITDAALERPDLDESRTAAMGGSYGGYLANWIAGHTDRFRAIVTHASLWQMPGFSGTTDSPGYWVREWGLPLSRPERYAQWSPHLFAERITTPMLVVHGDKDYRVPIGEGLQLWWDLQRLGVESRFLYYPDESHWVLSPGGAQVWYETVLAWLDQHLLGRDWVAPPLL